MPSATILEQKQAQVAEIKSKLQSAASVVFVDYKGINVADDTKLRAELRAAGVEYLVVKNSILRHACEELGQNDFLPLLAGTTAVAISVDDPIAPAKVMQPYSDRLKTIFNLKGGSVDGGYATTEQLKAIATLPSREGLIAQVAGSLNGIIASLARAIDEVAKKQAA